MSPRDFGRYRESIEVREVDRIVVVSAVDLELGNCGDKDVLDTCGIGVQVGRELARLGVNASSVRSSRDSSCGICSLVVGTAAVPARRRRRRDMRGERVRSAISQSVVIISPLSVLGDATQKMEPVNT